MFEVKFSATGEVSLKVEKRSRAKIINEALTAAGIQTTVTVNKTVDLTTKPRKPATTKTTKSNKK